MKPKGAIHIKYKVERLPFQVQYNFKNFIGKAEFVYIYKRDYTFSAHIKNEIRLYEKVGFKLYKRDLTPENIIAVLKQPKPRKKIK